MPTFSWIPDVPPGVLRNNAISSKLRKQAVAESKFMAFVKPEPGYGRHKGDTITIPRTKSLPEPINPRITEQQKIPIDKFQIGTTSIVVTEWGRGVEITNLAEQLNTFDLKSPIQSALKDQMKLSLDTGAASAFKSAMIKYTPTSATAGTFSLTGTPGATAGFNLTMAHIAEMRDYMYFNLFVPPIDAQGHYICLATTKALRGIKSDTNWIEWTKYTDPSKMYNSEVGKIEQVRFIEINHAQALSGAIGTGGVLGEAVMFGADAVASAIVEDPHLRAEAVPGDFGRQMAVAWYGILEFGLVWPTANAGEARVIHISSL
jgi:N4-gp56 family major capsid protein